MINPNFIPLPAQSNPYKSALRFFIQKKSGFDQESVSLKHQISSWLKFDVEVEVVFIYELFSQEEIQLNSSIQQIFCHPVSDEWQDMIELNPQDFAVEYLPGQFDIRGHAAMQCLMSLGIEGITVKTGKIYRFSEIAHEKLLQIKKILINPIESRQKDLSVLSIESNIDIAAVEEIKGFLDFDATQLKDLYQTLSISLPYEDLVWIQSYFQKEKRNPTITELKVLDTYWSDHCRHTTFETELTQITFQSKYNHLLQRSYDQYLSMRADLGISKPIRLMDMGTIAAKWLKKQGILNNVDESEEVNACSVVIEVDNDGVIEPWLLQFKNETHNHPTEIEPFGGASTCIGGAIRDPLSGRAYVYQAMRVTGSANPLESFEDTLPGKLPQAKISKEAALGYSSYGNQIGIPTTLVRELFHPGYRAKRMEVGFVVGAVPKDWVRRETPMPGDIVILLAGRTGRDGIGGATGSSRLQDMSKLDKLSAEVQKGNAPEERKIQRFFRQKEVIQMIKRSNDFGAGGVSVAIGEIARGVAIDLDAVPLKYQGLNGTEIALSESQERMAVVIEAKDKARFIEMAQAENLEATQVALVTSEERLVMHWQGQKIVDIDRKFLDSNGIPRQKEAVILDSDTVNPLEIQPSFTKENFLNHISALPHCSQNGLIQLFDSNVGRSTVLAPLGGQYQRSPEDISVHTLPTEGDTKTVSMASFGFHPMLSEYSPYHGAFYAVVESVARLVAGGADYRRIHLSFQEYFERLSQSNQWGKPVAALLGALEAQTFFQIAAIGGKDSMSGSFEQINVPPTLISFAIAPNQIDKVKSSVLTEAGHYIYLIEPKLSQDFLPDASLCSHYDKIYEHLSHVSAMKAMTHGGLAHTLMLMSFGNEIGVKIHRDIPLMTYLPGSIVVVSSSEIADFVDFEIGKTIKEPFLVFLDISFAIEALYRVYERPFAEIFPEYSATIDQPKIALHFPELNTCSEPKIQRDIPRVLLPIFLGMNSEYDTQKAFEQCGASVSTVIIRDFQFSWLEASIAEFSEKIYSCEILCLSGGFSASDEPDGSGKFIANMLRNQMVKEAIHLLLQRGGLILGICNGFQALIQSGLLPYGQIQQNNYASPILYHNAHHHHVAKMAKIKVVQDNSPWLRGLKGKTYWMPVSHGEGRMLVPANLLQEWIDQQQLASHYVDLSGNIALQSPYNVNGSTLGIEGIISACGRIYGKMGHPERVRKGLFANIPDLEEMPIFQNAVDFFRNAPKN
ncbi:MAG: phosphoribosylformylglycinamidine synthase [Chitinophagales bacterium]|jgi:phosphoribosylformylglycinamidine synthase|nr:phosphoribosylformylglycinamidine synthase [Chitinophagales bacterium]